MSTHNNLRPEGAGPLNPRGRKLRLRDLRSRTEAAHLLTHLLAHLGHLSQDAQLFARMEHDNALILRNLPRAMLTVGVGLHQVSAAVLIAATLKYLVANSEQCLLLLEEVERCATVGACGKDIGAGAQQTEQALGTTFQRGDMEGGEPVLGAAPVRVHAGFEHCVHLAELAPSRRVIQLS
eukprot:scaffold84224_cov57-Phaeocystis_antarctica.AAC.6